ncbi:hypothetical protein F2Q68_00015278 [Brassica cretica]|uniref:Uncharacterized protein n=1 Tax=Brassica cretica TaxID=69181 RepID=A0A8S9HGA4_BRACR|nr:hypothetical protein F2Q68_00015278 [Brassica cretica]
MVKRRCCLERDQFHGFISVKVLKFNTPPGGSKNCPEAEGGSVRGQISLSRPVSFFMRKPRLCPIRDQLSPVQSNRLLGHCFLKLVPLSRSWSGKWWARFSLVDHQGRVSHVDVTAPGESDRGPGHGG